MSVIAIHRLVRRLRRSAALLVVTCVLGGAIAVAHSGMPDMHASGMAAFCLAVLPAVALLPRHRSPSAPLGWRDRSGWWREKGYLELVRVNAQRSRRRARGATALLGALVATALLISASSSRNDSCRTVSFTSAIRRRSYRALAPPNRSRV